MELIGQTRFRRYSRSRSRSLITMVGYRAFQLVNGSASHHLFKPFVVLAARALGPGPTRLRLVKLAHNMTPNMVVIDLPRGASVAEPESDDRPTRRAA